MPPSPAASVSTVQAPLLAVPSAPTYYLGSVKVKSSTDNPVFSTSNLQITTNSTISGYALNINSSGSTAYLTIDGQGVLNTVGSITTTSSINSSSINTNSISVYRNGSLTGVPTLTISDTGDLTIKSNFSVAAESGAVISGTISSKDITVTGQISSTGTISVSSGKVILSNDGSISSTTLHVGTNGERLAVTDASVSTSKNLIVGSSAIFNVNSATGALTTSGDLKTTNGTVYAQNLNVSNGKATINSNGEAAMTKITATSGSFGSSGNLVINADGSISAATGKTLINVDGSASFASTNAKIGNDGHFETNFSSHILPTELRSSKATTGGFTTTATSKYLANQNYVDDGLWYIQKQINLITNDDSSVVDSFNNVFSLVKKLTGDGAIQTLDGIIDTTDEIKVSISDVIANSENAIVMDCKSTVWADACAPLPIPASVSSQYFFDGWFFENMINTVDTNTTNKMNLYVPANGMTMTIADVLSICMTIFAVSNKALPFISLYTQPKGTNDLFSSFAHARINYYFEPSTPLSTTSNISYCLYTGLEVPTNEYNVTNLKCTSTSTANATNKNNGTYGTVKTDGTYDTTIVQPTDKISCFAISTGSLYTKNHVKFILSQFKIRQKTGTTKFLFNNSAVATNYLFNTNFRINSDMTGISTSQYPTELGGLSTYYDKYTATYVTPNQP